MNLLEADTKLRELGQALITTSDAAAILGITRSYASKVLARLASAKRAVRLMRSRWVLCNEVDPLAIPEHLTAPRPSYISLQSALFHHGMVSQIPSVVYAVSLAPTGVHKTTLGVFSIHHIAPEFFFGYELAGKHAVKMATPEKALLDLLYLSPARSRLFASLPEIELPRSFKKKRAYEILARITSQSRRTLVSKRLEEIFR